MINIDTGCIVDILASRESAEVSKWLATFPNIEVVSRDGSMSYAKAIKTAHPNALQVNDRFHIVKGLTDAARKYVMEIISQRIPITSDAPPSGFDIPGYWPRPSANENISSQRLHNEATERREAKMHRVRELATEGFNRAEIRKITGYSDATIKKYLDPNFTPEYKCYGSSLPSKIKPYCDTIDTLLSLRKTFREVEIAIRKMGYDGSNSTIRMYASRKRRLNQAAVDEYRKNIEFIERKDLLKLLYNPIERVKAISQEQLNKVVGLHPQLLSVYDLIHNFRAIIADRRDGDLESWLDSAKAIGSSDIDSFVKGIMRDVDATKNAIIHSYNNGPAEGSINKLKRIKHTMYGRASFSTLRMKVLMYESWRCIN